MENHIQIGDFVKLTGSTLKTVLYYHKIGLLPEPARSAKGYRLYGPKELMRMRVIKHVKSLGCDLTHIKEILGDIHDDKTLREVLQSLHAELLDNKKCLEVRIEKIEKLLSEDTVHLDENSFAPPSFQMLQDILGTEQIETYARTCPALFTQQQKLYGLLDDFKWGEDYRETFRALAEFFKAHPLEYQTALAYGARLARLSQLPEDDPEVEALARESAAFIKSIPQLREILGKQPGIKKALSGLYNSMTATIISPAQIKHGQLLRRYLDLDD